LKLFKKISAYADHVTPQSDLGKVRSKRTFFERLEMQRDDILIETCQQVLCVIGDSVLQRLSAAKYLLTFDHHDSIISSSFKALAFCHPQLQEFPPLPGASLFIFFICEVQPRIVWFGLHCLKIEKIQRKFVKFLHFNSFCSERFSCQFSLFRI
jgi:hypothetical protein